MPPAPSPLPLRPWLYPSLVAICIVAATWSFTGTADRPVWAFEVLPLCAVMLVFGLRRQHFCFSDLAYLLLTWFFLIQCVGGRYTFEHVPFPQTLLDWLSLQRNPSDRIGHFFQGFVPAILLREWLIRRRGLPPGRTLFWLVTGCCLGFSAAYELLEMTVVLLFYPADGAQWLGMQGDPFDAQWDMTMALCGAITAQLLLRRLHDRSIARAT
jgi:putative membrane protein